MGNVLEHKMFVFDFLCNFRLKHLSLQEELGDVLSQMYFCLRVQYTLLLSDFNRTWILSTDFRKILKYQISRKSVQLEPSCCMRTDGQTDIETEVT